VSELRQFLKAKLPEYMVPSAFVFLDALPLTPNGKVDRSALKAPDSELNRSVSFIAPRDALELQLAQIWSEVLEVERIGIQDNFFDLGGHSLLAVRLMAKIQQQFGKNLPLATLFQGATIEQFAAILRKDSDYSVWSSLVAIQPSGSKPPFFCVPGAGGNVVYFYDLARCLGPDQPFYGLQALGLDGGEFYTRVEDMASHYIEAIQAVQPQGPYLLGGHSFGGKVAFEMAIQLQKQGQEVALLAIMDTNAPIISSKPVGLDWDDARWLAEFAKTVERVHGKNLEVSYAALQSLDSDEQFRYLLDKFEKENILPLGFDFRQFRSLVQVFKANHQVDYVSQEVYSNRITLFRASEAGSVETANELQSEILQDSAWGWGKLSAEPVDVHFVPGDHITMMTKPHVQVFGERLLTCIDKAQGDGILE
jgi:thioesterase domain-containing protein/acyl carrier protein